MPPVDFRPLFEDNPHPIVVFDRTTRVVLAVNNAACEHFGYTRQELVGRDVASLRPEPDATAMRQYYESERAKDSPTGPMPVPGVWRHQRKDGTILQTELWRIRIEWEGRPAVMVVISDVTARLQAEEAVRASEVRFRALVEKSDDATVMIDREGRIVYASPATAHASGYPPHELLGKTPLDILHPDDASRFVQIFDEVLARPGVSVPALYRAHHADGSWRWIDGVATNLLDVPGVHAIVANYRDVTAQVSAQAALRESEERYRLLFEAIPVPIFVFDADSLRYLAANEAAVRHYGYSREELSGMTVLDIRPPEDVPRLRETLAGLDRANLSTGVWRHRKRDGTIFEVEIHTHAIEFAGRPARLVVASDVTDRRRLEEQLRQSQKMEATGLLAGGLAHDFNNLLGVVLGAAELARRATRAGRAVEPYLNEIDAAAARATELTRKLLAFSSKQLLHVRALDLGALVADFSQLLRRAIGEDVELVVDCWPAPLVVNADGSQLEQVLLNLCTNARQAMPGGGRIVLQTRLTRFEECRLQQEPWAAPGQWAELRVVDSGVGMDPATQAHAFEPFFTTRQDGTGLGLAVVHGVVRQHHGFVHVESQPGKGTTVRVCLPLGNATDVVRDLPPTPALPVRGGQETLLIAEDEGPLRGLLATTLSELGYHVVTADDGAEAVRLFTERQGQIALVILDVVMPEVSGVEAYEKMRALKPGLKVIFVTGYAPAHAQVSKILEKGGHALLVKPFTLKDLGHKVREALDGRP